MEMLLYGISVVVLLYRRTGLWSAEVLLCHLSILTSITMLIFLSCRPACDNHCRQIVCQLNIGLQKYFKQMSCWLDIAGTLPVISTTCYAFSLLLFLPFVFWTINKGQTKSILKSSALVQLGSSFCSFSHYFCHLWWTQSHCWDLGTQWHCQYEVWRGKQSKANKWSDDQTGCKQASCQSIVSSFRSLKLNLLASSVKKETLFKKETTGLLNAECRGTRKSSGKRKVHWYIY